MKIEIKKKEKRKRVIIILHLGFIKILKLTNQANQLVSVYRF